MRIANKKASKYIRQKDVFKGNNLFSEQVKNGYVVYSYGYHFPLYVYSGIDQKWYKNIAKYSKSTSKHSSQADPEEVCEELNLQQIKGLILALS